MSSVELEEAPGHYFVTHSKSACGKLDEVFHGKITLTEYFVNKYFFSIL